jgi:hypothetical protein
MADNEEPKCAAQAEQDEAILIFRVLWIVDQACSLVEKHRPRLLKGDAVFLRVLRSFAFVSLEAKRAHTANITTM